jgi:serine/threonine protein kinase/tetratricopeptide (TPR) repeat protein
MQSGDVVADRFEIEALAARGGMGAVYRARDHVGGSVVALKILQGSAPGDRFFREAQLLAELRHPAIVRYVDHGLTSASVPYLAMEWLEGETLAARLRRQPLEPAESLLMTARLGDALAMAHGRGVVHRDVKPSNILLVDGRPERAKILDFGVARLAGPATLVTLTGAVLGTPGYMAPEQARGDRQIDGRADVFSLGCVLFQCLTGRAAFSAKAPLAVLAKLILDDTPRLCDFRPELPPELDELVTCMLAKEPDERPSDLAELAASLTRLDLDEASNEAPRRPSGIITGAERRVVCVLLACDALTAVSGDVGAGPSIELTSSDVTLVERPLHDDEEDSRVARSLQAAVASVEGRLEPLRDGSLVIALGGGGSATDLACRAARCALAVRAIVPEARIGLATGRAVIGPRVPLGQVIEGAAALVDRLTPGEVCVDSVTAGLIDARFSVTTSERGVVRLERERAETEELRQLLGKPTPTVGRERELGFLMGLVDECLEEPMARVALVTGPAGVGKSRVRYELQRRLHQRDTTYQSWLARADPSSAGSPFGLLGRLIRQFAGLLDGEPPAASRERLHARVGRHVPAGSVERVARFLGEIARVPSDDTSAELMAARRDPILMGDQMRRAWEELVLAECRAEPVLLVLEDLHWGDLPSVKLVDAALRAAAEQPFMVLALARPEVHERFPGLWSGREPQEIALGGLTRRAAEKLVREALGESLDEATLKTLVKRADGNAFFLEELIRAVGEGNSDQLPDSVLAMLQMRLEALPDAARRTLRAASVFGKAFWLGAVSGLVGRSLDAVDIREWLDLLVEREVVTPRYRSRFPGEVEYAFRHALVAEAAYAMLTPEDRARGHLAAGGWLQGNGEPDKLALAGHFDKGGDAERALEWYRLAAQDAIDGNDFETALVAVASARASVVTRSGSATELAELLRLEAEAHLWRGEYRDAEVAGERALGALAPHTPDWFRSIFVVVSACQQTGDLDRVVEIAGLLLALPCWDQPTPALMEAASRVAVVLTHTGRFEAADPLFEQLEGVADSPSCADPVTRARWLTSKASRALYRGETEHYATWSKLASETFARMGDRRNAAIQRHNAGHGSYELGAFAEAEEHLRAAHDLAEELGLPNVVAAAKTNLGYVLTRLGELDAARELLVAAVAMLEAQGDRRMQGGALSHLAGLRLAQVQVPEAHEAARRAAELLEPFPPVRVHALARRAEAELGSGDVDRAVATTGLGMELLDELGGSADGELALRLCRAKALDELGEHDQAREVLRTAYERLSARAAAIEDDALRRSFLEQVPENAGVSELARAWEIDG